MSRTRKAWLVIALLVLTGCAPSSQVHPSLTPTGKPLATATATPLSAPPVQLAPANGRVFSNYPRTTTLQWQTVDGAASYTVEVQLFQPANTTCTNGTPLEMTDNLKQTSYTFDFVGAQPGCWRVWAVDSSGQAGAKSG